MRGEFYQGLHSRLSAKPRLVRGIAAATRGLPGVVYCAYPGMLLYLAFTGSPRLLRCLLVPAAGFLLVTALRGALNFPRPYEVLGIPPLVDKRTKGKSFPSRHAACGAVIAVTALYVLPGLGAGLWVVSALIALTRVLSGVHFVRDVLAGLGLGALVGIIGMGLIP